MFPSPLQLGLPRKFKEWRSNQRKAIEDGLGAHKRFVVQALRQGEGKSLSYMAQALMDTTHRYIILTSTKGLQDQLMADFEGCGLVDIRGKSSYNCEGLPGHTCAEGSVAKCCYKGTSLCEFNAAKYQAGTQRTVVSNYPCWIASNKYSQGFGKFDVMVCDEAHNILSEIEKAVSVQIGEHEMLELGREWPDMRSRDDMQAWKHWAAVSRSMADRELQRLKLDLEQSGKSASMVKVKKFNHLAHLVRRLAEVQTCRADKWVVDEWMHGYKFDPIDSSEHIEKLLFRGVEKVLLQSGTISRHTIDAMNISISDCHFYEYYTHVNPAKSPIMYIPTAKVNMYAQPWELRKIVARVDEIFESRMDRKGIVHTSNYKLRDFIMSNSKYSRYFVSNYTNQGDLTSHVIDTFKEMAPPALLVSPSLTTGYDFPYDDCRYQIIAKLNYPYAGSKVEQARTKLNPDRGSAHAVLSLQQAVGRGDRASDDFQEVFIIDDAFPMLKWKYETLFSPQFLACIRTLNKIPKAPFWEAA